MPTYTLATNDYDCDPAVKNAYIAAANPIIQPYITADACTQPPTYTPTMESYPPTSGIYVARRDWVNQSDADAFCASIATLLANNPSYTQFVTSAPAVFNE